MRSYLLNLGVAGVGVTSALIPIGPPAFAASVCSSTQSSGHCYAIMEVDNTEGVKSWQVQVKVNDSSVCFGDYNYAFANEELWAFSNGATTGGHYWVETGIKYARYSASEYYETKWFWADSKPAGYAEHYPSVGYSINTSYPVKIEYQGGSTDAFNIYDNGTLVGTSTSNGGPSFGAQAGLEVRYANTNVVGQVTNAEHDPSGAPVTLVKGWYSPYLYVTPNTVGTWVNSNHYGLTNSYQHPTSSCAILSKAATPLSNPKTATASEATNPSPAESDLVQRAKGFAATNGDSDVSAAVVSTWSDASTVPDDLALSAGQGPVTTVTLEGNFSGEAASAPKGSPMPSGKYLTMAYDATGKLTDWSLTNDAPSTEGSAHEEVLP